MGCPLSPVPTQGNGDMVEPYQIIYPIITPHRQAETRKELVSKLR
jgi:hypothetical protein